MIQITERGERVFDNGLTERGAHVFGSLTARGHRVFPVAQPPPLPPLLSGGGGIVGLRIKPAPSVAHVRGAGLMTVSACGHARMMAASPRLSELLELVALGVLSVDDVLLMDDVPNWVIEEALVLSTWRR